MHVADLRDAGTAQSLRKDIESQLAGMASIFGFGCVEQAY
jgi:hypothetical protein